MHTFRTVREAPLSKIVGGTFATPHEFPYQINLRYHDELLCGGSILSTLFILTAAHCVKYKLPSKLSIVAGDHDHLLSEGNEQIRNVSHIFMHEHYNWDSDENDIAILALSKPLEFNNYVKNISWPEKSVEFSGLATVTGWGKITESSPSSDVLQKTRVPIVKRSDCQNTYKKFKMNITSSMLCAGEMGKDSCRGDSGGPLVCRMSDNSEVQCGITSHGIGCGRKGFPGVYTDVSKYNEWITITMDQFRLQHKCKMSRFYCAEDRKCVPRSTLCNGINDCFRGSDERGCEETSRTPPSHFRCNNGVSIRANWVCDKVDDCGDKSDENKCDKAPCSLTQFACKSDARCVEKSWLCDDIIDCDDASDEADCGDNNELIPVTQNQTFSKPKPISTSAIAANNAGDSCEKGFFRCPGNRIRGICIPNRWVCDGQNDCRSGEDEANCSATQNSTSTMIPATPTSTPTTTPTPSIMPRTQCTPTQFYCNSSDICIPKSFLCDGDSDCRLGEDEANCTLNMGANNPRPFLISGRNFTIAINSTRISLFPFFKPKPCLGDQFQCGSGACIPQSFVCDLDQDCDTDELNCTTKPKCSTFQWACTNGDCIYHRFRCDGDIDCIDSSDERGCNTRTTSNNCTSLEFPCRTGECIPNHFRCDTDEDCILGDDEERCFGE